MSHCYHINQFVVETALSLPVSTICNIPIHEQPIIHIDRFNHESRNYDHAFMVGYHNTWHTRGYDVGSGLLVSNPTGYFLLIDKNGANILVDANPANEYQQRQAMAVCSNLGVSVCSLFCGYIPIHAAGAVIDDHLIGIMAPSGTGKTTLLWELLNAGACFATDDVLNVEFRDESVFGHPSVTLHAKLSGTAIESRIWDTNVFEETNSGHDEYWIPIPSQDRLTNSRKLSALFLLTPVTDQTVIDNVRYKQVTDGLALSCLMGNTQGLSICLSMLDPDVLLNNYRHLIKNVPVFVVNYFKQFDQLPRISETIRTILSQL